MWWLHAAVAISGVVVLVAGCVAAPESIKPAYVDSAFYQGRTCATLAENQAAISQMLSAAYAAQNTRRSEDAERNVALLAVLLFGGFTFYSEGPDETQRIADLKGDQAAALRVQKDEGCVEP